MGGDEIEDLHAEKKDFSKPEYQTNHEGQQVRDGRRTSQTSCLKLFIKHTVRKSFTSKNIQMNEQKSPDKNWKCVVILGNVQCWAQVGSFPLLSYVTCYITTLVLRT